MDIKSISLNKNRGWRGLAQLECMDTTGKVINKMIFSFSGQVWDDLMINHKIAIKEDNTHYVITITDPEGKLPVGHQRSVLLKNLTFNVTNITEYKPDDPCPAEDWNVIAHFKKNNNNHTTSDWNYIGVRVMPTI